MNAIDVLVLVCAALLTSGAFMAVLRAERGPSMLDRTVALDIVVTTMIAGVALYAAYFRRADVVPLLVVLSLVGFVGSVTIARFAAVEPEGEGRVRTREEVAAEEAEKRRLEQLEEEERRARRKAAAAEAKAAAPADGPATADGHGDGGEVGDPVAEPVPESTADTVEDEPDPEHHGGPAEGEIR